ncbi:uncharacterized protein V1510DRAFT_402013 [Dipodascopsis tothii]|uniref:uncharacterized protein n=1 Tax=Dipodascopsis tothii TaxID=44089 RepID=UPI0034CF6CFE
MEFIDYQLENREQFWEELDGILTQQIHSASLIEAAVRTFLRFVGKHMDQFLAADEDLAQCGLRFIGSPVFVKHRGQVRRRLITKMVGGECDARTLLMIGVVLLLDGRQHVDTFEMMEEESACRLMVDVLWRTRETDPRLHSIMLELVYELCRVQRLQRADLEAISTDFIEFLFQTIERNDDYERDPYSYGLIRVLLVLNEQYMLSGQGSGHDRIRVRIPNKVVGTLRLRGGHYRAFGSNIIILLNREREVCVQLLILKMLYQLFTTPETYEYFYTNDLRVLIDVFVRELHDLSDEAETLKHTYLRVFYPLLAHTQLRHSHYKQYELVKLFRQLEGRGRSQHFRPVSETTARLVTRCMHVPWLQAAAARSELPSPDLLAPDMALANTSTLSLPSSATVTENLTGASRTVPVKTLTTTLPEVDTLPNGNGVELISA